MIQLDTIFTGDCLQVLKTLPDESVHCCVTSPPYYALRDYGMDGQIGRETTPKEYVSRLTDVFAEVRRVLRSDGTLWLNISDTYAGKGNQGDFIDPKNPNGRNGQAIALNNKVEGCKPKDMIGIPWLLAFALRDSGWYLRNDIIWMKENPMPESVKDRCARCYEHMSTLGNREDLFGDSEYVDKYITNPPADYDVPAEYLDDATFATLLSEAEKYIGYPYVWGGSNPSTSFDCSGFVSYVLTNSGLCNTGRLGAQGLYNICTPVSDPQPGDLVFFVGTYDTPGVSHVGIYVGDQVMLHCGDPIQYTSIASSYWQNHFYAYGRPPY